MTDNPVMAAPDGLSRIWRLDRAGEDYPQYYPVTYSAFWLQRQAWGLEPSRYVLVNAALHCFNAVLVWRLLAVLGIGGAWLAAALFAVHPVQVESVAWITELKNLLSGAFFLLALLAHVRFEERARWRWYAAALGLFLAAMLSKTSVCTFPFVLLLLRWRSGRPVNSSYLAALVPFFAVAFGLGYLTMRLDTVETGEYYLGLAERILVSSRALWFYAAKLAWPVDLTFNYERWRLDAADPRQWVWVASAVVAAGKLWKVRARRGVVAGIGFFVVMLLPALGVVGFTYHRYSYVADHFQYLASIGLFALVAGGLAAVAVDRARAVGVACAVLIAVLWGATWRRAHAYQSAETLWLDTLAKNPGAYAAQVCLGGIRMEQGRAAEAEGYFQRAVEARPDLAEGHYNLGFALGAQGKSKEAVAAYEAAVRLSPGFAKAHVALAQAHYNLGGSLVAEKRLDEAVYHYQETLRLTPRFAQAHNNLGVAWASQGHLAKAAEAFRKALELEPDHQEAKRNLAQIGRK